MAEDYIKKIWEILTTLTKEAQNAALAKCKELELDLNRGEVSLDESLINLNAANLILTDAIEKQKLIQLPITVQKAILSNLESVSKSLTGLVNGIDEVVNLVNTIEKLNTAIWQYGFHNFSEEVLGYQTKLNQNEPPRSKLRGIIKLSICLLVIPACRESFRKERFWTSQNDRGYGNPVASYRELSS